MPISAILLNWDGIVDTPKAFNSLMNSTVVPDELIVIDNNSIDESRDWLIQQDKKVPNYTLVLLGRYMSLTRALNLAIALSNPSNDVFFMGNDVVIEKNCIEELLKVTADPSVGMAVGKVQMGNRFWHTGKTINLSTQTQEFRFDKEISQVESAEWAYVLWKRKLIETIGLLDETFYLYYQDVDYCLRARQAGFKIMTNPSALGWHEHASKTVEAKQKSGEYPAEAQGDPERFWRKWWGKEV